MLNICCAGADQVGVTSEQPAWAVTLRPATCPGCGAALTAARGGLRCAACGRAAPGAASGAAPPGAALPGAAPVHSRWRGGPTSFGPLGRLLLTALVLLPPALLVWVAGPMGLTMCVGWLILGVPLLLRSVWTRARVR